MLTLVTHNGGSPELRINFGVFAGRSATGAEIDELARKLLPELGDVTIVAEEWANAHIEDRHADVVDAR